MADLGLYGMKLHACYSEYIRIEGRILILQSQRMFIEASTNFKSILRSKKQILKFENDICSCIKWVS